MRALKNDKGFNLIQMILAMGIAGVVGLGALKLTEESNKSAKRYEQALEVDTFLAEISRQMGKKENCDLNFQNEVFSSSPVSFTPFKILLNDGSSKDFLVQDEVYLSNRLKLNSLDVLSLGPDKLRVNLGFEQLKKTSGYNKVIKSVDLNVVATSDGAGNQTIEACSFSNSAASENANENIAAEICDGLGLVEENERCYIKDFFQSYDQTLDCADGQTVAGIEYDSTTYFNSGDCRSVFTKPAACAGSKIRSVAADGAIECLDAEKVANNSYATFFDGSECSLVVDATNKLGVNCSGCSPLCPDPSTICVGETNTDPDGCGGSCNVVGTKTGASCDSCDASNESSTRVKLAVVDVSGSCPADQTEYDEWETLNVVTYTHIPDNTPDVDLTGGKIMADSLFTMDCFRAYRNSSGSSFSPSGSYLLHRTSVQSDSNGDKVPHVLTVNTDGSFSVEKCSVPGGGGCSYPSDVSAINECSGAGVCAGARMCDENDGVDTYLSCPPGDTCNCIASADPCPSS